MTPRLKAIELLRRFMDFSLKYEVEAGPGVTVYTQIPAAKQCAIIAVDEIIKEIPQYPAEQKVKKQQYWQQVKEEITLL